MSELHKLERLRQVLTSKIDGYIAEEYEGIAFHSSSIIISVNCAVADMFGYSEDEMFGMNAWRLFTTESFELIMHHLVEKSEEPYQVKGIKKDKTEFGVELKGKDFEVHGEPVRAVMLREIV